MTMQTENIGSTRQALGGALASPEFTRLWQRHYVADIDENPAIDVVAALEHADHFDLRDDPELLTFLITFCEIELRALGHARQGEAADVQQAREMAEYFRDYLLKISSGLDLPHRDDLAHSYQNFLSMMEKETAQVPFRPMRGFINIMKHIAEHVNEHRKEHPWGFRSLVLGACSYLAVVYWKVGSSATIYTEPELTEIENMSMDDLLDPNWVPEGNKDLFTLDFTPSCHDHIKQLFSLLGEDTSQKIADTVRDTLDMGGLFPQHCNKIKNLAEVAQERAEGMYDFWNTRIAIFIEDGQMKLADKALPDGRFKDGFIRGADNMAELIYAGNTLENIILHGMIGLTSYAMTVKLGTMDDEESSEAKAEIKNFAHRTIKNVPLTYLFAATGAAYGYVQTHSVMDPQTVWMGIGGALAGHFVHKTVKARKKKETAANWMQVSKDFVKEEVDLAKILVSSHRAGEKAPSNPMQDNASFWKNHKWKVAGGLTAAFAAADAQLTGGYLNGLVSGGMTVLVPFLGFNVVEDTTAHFVFGLGGAAAGMVHVGIQRGLKRLFSKRVQTSSEPLDVGNVALEHDHHDHHRMHRRYAQEVKDMGLTPEPEGVA